MPDLSPDLPRAAIDVRDVLDALWLAAWLSRPQPVTEESARLPVTPDIQTTPRYVGDTVDRAATPAAVADASAPTPSTVEPSSRAAGALYAPGDSTAAQKDVAIRARPIRIPAGSALPNSLSIARAIRAIPARVRSRIDMDLDEDATVDASAQGAGVVPVFRPRLERWFEAALVVDHSPSAEMWAQTVIELERMMRLAGVFRDVRTFRLERRPELRLLNESDVAQRLSALRDPMARRIVFLFSPGVTELWTDGTFGRLIGDWGASTPVALLHALPRRLWTSTALGEPVALTTNPTPGGPNTGLRWKQAWWALARRIDGVRVVLPVLALDPDSTRRWAEMFAARRGRSAPAFLVPIEAGIDRRSREAVRPQPSLQERIDRFRTHAPDAFKLAVRLAVGPFTMPILQLVQSSLFGRDADHSQIAEVMLSGLVRRLTPIDAPVPPEQVQFQFVRDASPLLLESLRRDDARRLAALLQGYIEEHFGIARDQVVLLGDPEGPAQIPEGAQPFAQLNERFMQWLHDSSPRALSSTSTPTITKAEIVPDIAPSETSLERQLPAEQEPLPTVPKAPTVARRTELSGTVVRREGQWKAHIVGGGLAGLAAAAYLIRNAGVPGQDITIYEARERLGGAFFPSGSAQTGYNPCGHFLLGAEFRCTFDLLATIPSVTNPRISIKDELSAFNASHPFNNRVHIIDRNGTVAREPRFGLNAGDGLALSRLALTPEASLDGRRIEEFFSPKFFSTEFWLLCSTITGSLPQHSATEFRRYLNRGLIANLSDKSHVLRTPFNHYQAFIEPLVAWLRPRGVEFLIPAFVCDIGFTPSPSQITVNRLDYERDGVVTSVGVGPEDLVLVTIGSQVADLAAGSMTAAPRAPGSGRSWALWKRLAHGRTEFGNPDVFFDAAEAPDRRWVTFTVTTTGTEFIDLMTKLTGNEPGTGRLATLKDSSWLLSLSPVLQQEIQGQPDGTYVWWGYGLYPERAGDFVLKRMAECTGAEILEEVVRQLRFDNHLNGIMRSSICIPCDMPYVNNIWMPRRRADRPPVVPKGATNLGLIGQYVEVEREMAFTVEYSARTAWEAIYLLLKRGPSPPPVYQGQFDPKAVFEALKVFVGR